MLAGKNSALEIGCGDAFGTPLILQNVRSVHGIDIEPLIIEDNRERMKEEALSGSCTFSVSDITENPLEQKFEAAFSLDVIEHIPQRFEQAFMRNIALSLEADALCILGTPNLDAAQYASAASQEGHINLKNESTLRSLMASYYNAVFVFSMNDEIVHTGYYPMAHYLFAVGVGVK
jgi:2-polyprenyl-3-methyl-5-hydroxy-6-metoxy-1,4-benzoquinol methylase